jgi:hypothetical protein
MTTYYNRFDPAKRWLDLMAVPGRRLQAAELNEIQSIALNRDKELGNAIFGTGYILDGCQILVEDDLRSVRITAGRIYYEGIIHEIPETSLPINGTGEEVIGFKVEYQISTYEQNPELLDPAVGFENYGLPGMDRRVTLPRWVVNDIQAIPIYKLIDGVPTTVIAPPEISGITPVLARRTFDESGNYLVTGMDGYIEPLNQDNVVLVIEAGKAYILGFEINKLIPSKIIVPKAKSTRTVVNETKVYQTDTATYLLNSRPVKSINMLTGVVEVTEVITRSNIPGTSDPLLQTPVVDIISVTAGTTTYVRDVDYKLAGNFIDWSLGGQEPVPNTSYTVTYRYTKVFVNNVDYKVENDYIEFLSGDKPVDNTNFQVSYDFYLARKDIFYITSKGEFKVVYGQPEIWPALPPAPPDVLTLGALYLPANSDDVVVTDYKPKRLTMLELRSMLDRLERSEYNAAIESLDREAQITDPTIQKKGIFTDNFTNFERMDVTHPDFDAMIDPSEKVLVLPENQQIVQLTVNTDSTDVVLKERLGVIEYTEEVVLQQPLATEHWNVNPYNVFSNIATIRLSPSHDSWIEQSVITKVVRSWWLFWWFRSRVESKILMEENVPFIRIRDVDVVGEGFVPNSDNIQATFDGILVNLVPTGTTQEGSTPGTVKSDANGRLKAKFTIPPNVRTGTREVRLFNYF